MRPSFLAFLLLATPALAERPAELVRLPEPAGLGRLLTPPGGAGGPLVILLPDALGDDGRAEPYAEALAARGIASLTLGLGEDADSPAAPDAEPAAAAGAVPAALGWAEGAGFDPRRVGLIGFGAGGRAALRASTHRPVVALYPGCRGLVLPVQASGLVLQGEDAPDAGACARTALPPGIALQLLPGLGHGWDAPGALWPSEGPLLPDPAGGARVRARTDVAATIALAAALAEWFGARLLPGAPGLAAAPGAAVTTEARGGGR